MTFLKSIRLSGFLSFPNDAPAVDLEPLNVLIGPNASGKSNLMEAVELLHATPTNFAAAVGGGVQEWIWKGDGQQRSATIEAVITGEQPIPELRYRLTFAAAGQRTEVVDEVIEEPDKRFASENDVYFYYRYQHGHPVINVRQTTTTTTPPPHTNAPTSPPTTNARLWRQLTRTSLFPDESVLSQLKDPDLYPELTWLARRFERIQMFREWTFGRDAALRQQQRTDMQSDTLLPDCSNLGLILNELEHSGMISEFNSLLTRFLPRYERFSTRIHAGNVQLYLHESGLRAPVPATRLSDGTIRFMAMLALLLSPSPPPLICMEEPELGLHPDAVSLLADLLVDASERSQLIVTTHSDTLVSALSDHANSVLVCEFRGGTQLKRVDPDELQHWMDQYRLGEIWRIGELGGNP